MTKVIQEFVERLSVENGVGLFYFSGHSVQIDGEEYLTPVDFNFENHHERWKYNMVSVDSIVKQMQSANSKLNIIILDSSRADPFLR